MLEREKEGGRQAPPPPSDVHESSAGGKKTQPLSMPPPPPPPPPPAFQDVVVASPGPSSAAPPPPFFAAVAGRAGQGHASQAIRPPEPSSSFAAEASRMSAQPEQMRLDELVGMLTAGDDEENQVVESSQVTAR